MKRAIIKHNWQKPELIRKIPISFPTEDDLAKMDNVLEVMFSDIGQEDCDISENCIKCKVYWEE